MDKFTQAYAPPMYINLNGEINNNNQEVVGWVHDNNTKAQSFLRANRGWKSADICMAIFYGDETDRIPAGLSKVSVKKLRRQAREAVANASNIRPRWKHRSRKDKFAEQAKTQDNLRDDWYYTQFIDQKVKLALQNAAGGGTGYIFLWPDYDCNTGQLEIQARVLNWRQVLPFHAGDDADIDTIFGLTVHIEMPVPEAHEKFPEHMGIIKADRNVPSFFSRNWQGVKRRFKGVVDRMRNNKPIAQDPYPVADIFYTWVRDNSINTTGHDILMGEAGAHYSYIVPSLYDENGKQVLGRTTKDCKLFPYKRLIISTPHGVIWDGPPFWINIFVPVVPFTFEKVVGEFLGINIIRDGRRLEDSANNILRSFEDAIKGRLSPPIGIDSGLPKDIKSKLKRNIRSMMGMTFEYNGIQLQKAVVPLIHQDYYNLDPKGIEIAKLMFEMQDYQMGTADLTNLNRLNQMPAADTQEHFLQALGALATDHSRGIEQSMIKLANIWLWFSFQVYTTERIIILLGADNVINTADFDPDNLVPKPEDYPEINEASHGDNAYAARLQKHIRNFSIFAAPNSLQERMSQTNKLILLQLLKMGVQISNKRLYDAFIDDGQFSIEKGEWKKEQIEKIEIAAELQKKLKMANDETDPMNRIAKSVEETIRGTNNEGRPNSNNESPQLKSKSDEDGIPRTTMTTS